MAEQVFRNKSLPTPVRETARIKKGARLQDNRDAIQKKGDLAHDPMNKLGAAQSDTFHVRDAGMAPVAPRNNTGLPDVLKNGVEQLSGMSLDHVKVHYNSSAPAQLHAHAYAQGSHIYVAPRQEQHLPHETWHVVQQAQGRVRPTLTMTNGARLNDEQHLEQEADVMGSRALAFGGADSLSGSQPAAGAIRIGGADVVQAVTKITYVPGTIGAGAGRQVVGREMHAVLDVESPVVGTATGKQWEWTRALRMTHRRAGVVRGHLLNHDLGGSGVPANLYPISTKANSEHSSKVEQHVKKLLNQVDAEYQARVAQIPAQQPADSQAMSDGPQIAAPPELVTYSVEVVETVAGNPDEATFHCSFHKGTEDAIVVPIVSKLASDQDRYAPTAGLIPGQDKVPAHWKWQHVGRHKGDIAWVDNLKKQQQIALDMGNLSTEWPKETTGTEFDYPILWDNFVTNDQANKTAFKTADGLYRLDQDKVKAYLMKNTQFLEELKEFIAKPVDPNAITAWLKDAVMEVSKIIPSTALPKKYQKDGQYYIAFK